jgi:3-oxoadipate enol-lactonase
LYNASVTTAQRQSGFFDTGDVILHYEVQGAGQGLILLHELGGSTHSWKRVADGLSARLRILSFDQRGHGLSEKVRRAYSIAEQTDDAKRLADGLDFSDRSWLVGVAAGAAVAVQFAVRYPQRVAGLVLCAPALSSDPARRLYLVERARHAAEAGMRAIAEASLDNSYPVQDRHGAGFDEYRARWLANDPVSYGLANLALADMSVLASAGAIACPCLLLAGKRDALRPPSYVEPLQALIPASRYAEVECGHIMPVQAPEALTDKIFDFVERCHDLQGCDA